MWIVKYLLFYCGTNIYCFVLEIRSQIEQLFLGSFILSVDLIYILVIPCIITIKKISLCRTYLYISIADIKLSSNVDIYTDLLNQELTKNKTRQVPDSDSQTQVSVPKTEKKNTFLVWEPP